MVANEVLEKFKLNEAYPYINEIFLDIDYHFDNKKDEIKQNFIYSFKETCKQILKIQNSDNLEVAFLAYTIIRTKILQDKNVLDIHIYDSNWYEKKFIKVAELDLSRFFAPIDSIRKRLNLDRKKYIGKINKNDVENIISHYLLSFNSFFIKTFRYCLTEATECEEFLDITKADEFVIYTGELYGEPYILHREVKGQKDLDVLKDNMIDKKPCANLDLKNLNLSCFDMSDNSYCYLDFRNSNLKSVNMLNTLHLGTLFGACDMMEADFMCSNLCETDFQNADLRGANFSFSLSRSGFFKRDEWGFASSLPLNLKGSNMQNVVFENSVIVGADFTEANIDGISFLNTKLIGSIFTRQQAHQLNLSNEQRSQVIII